MNCKKTKFRFLTLILFFTFVLSVIPNFEINAETEKKYIPGGMTFGASIFIDGVSVTSFTSKKQLGTDKNPAQKAGVKLGDIIYSINGNKVKNAEDLSKYVQNSNSENITVGIKRNGEDVTLDVKSYITNEGTRRLGINIRDNVGGIGTVTFIDSESGTFGGLGHGICDYNTGECYPIRSGKVTNVKINDIIKGVNGRPGEIRGNFIGEKTGVVISNTDKGVFGILAKVPSNTLPPVYTAKRHEVEEGKATVLCTLDDEGIKSYEIEISKIIDPSSQTKNFTVKITDKKLIEKTGGIIQGMSGSPILQNGKLIGAVTHVLVNDSSTGYGIFIENMLNASRSA